MRRSKPRRSVLFPSPAKGFRIKIGRFSSKTLPVFAFLAGMILVFSGLRPSFGEGGIFSALKDWTERVSQENRNDGRPGERPVQPNRVSPQAGRPQSGRPQSQRRPKSPQPQAHPINQTTGQAAGSSSQIVTPGGVTADALMKASTSPQSANEAVHQIPWNSLSPDAQRIVESMISRYSLYRRLPLAGGYCNPEVYDFMVCHPEIVIGLWQTLGFSQISLVQAQPGQYLLKEKTGTSADIRVLYHDNDMILLYCAGVYQGQKGQSMAKPIEGEALVIMQYRFTEDRTNGNAPIVITRLDSFMRLSNVGADLVGRFFAPVIGKIVDSNFTQTVEFVNNVSETMEKNPGALIESIQTMRGVSPDVKEEFLAYIDRTSSQAFLRSRGEMVDYYLLPKPNAPQVVSARLLSRNGMSEPLNGTAQNGTPQNSEALNETVTPNLPTVPLSNDLLSQIDSPQADNGSTLGTVIPIPQTTDVPHSGQKTRTVSGKGSSVTVSRPRPQALSLQEKNPLQPGTVLTSETMETFTLVEDSADTAATLIRNNTASGISHSSETKSKNIDTVTVTPTHNNADISLHTATTLPASKKPTEEETPLPEMVFEEDATTEEKSSSAPTLSVARNASLPVIPHPLPLSIQDDQEQTVDNDDMEDETGGWVVKESAASDVSAETVSAPVDESVASGFPVSAKSNEKWPDEKTPTAVADDRSVVTPAPLMESVEQESNGLWKKPTFMEPSATSSPIEKTVTKTAAKPITGVAVPRTNPAVSSAPPASAEKKETVPKGDVEIDLMSLISKKSGSSRGEAGNAKTSVPSGATAVHSPK